MDPVAALRRIAFLLERRLESSYRIKAYRGAANALADLRPEDVRRLSENGALTRVKGVGDKTAAVAAEALAGDMPAYLAKLEETAGQLAEGGETFRAALRGDLHTHSNWTDGGSPPEEMAETYVAVGHEYAALTDHSPRLTVARGLSAERLREQIGLVGELNERLAPFRILKGIEVNIRANGDLDVEDELLAPLDWVMASVHSSFDNDPTGRVLHAMESPHVDCVGHLTSRKIGKRDPSTIAVEKVVGHALETGTFLEINSQPDRLDLRDAHARLAGEAGLKLVVSSDGHSAGALGYVDLGIAQARRAWLTKEQILNTRPWAEIERLRKGAE